MNAIRKRIARAASEEGAVTVEAAIWLPFFFLLMIMLADIALIFHGQSRAFDAMAAVNRAYSSGEIATEAEAEAAIERSLAVISPNVSVQFGFENAVLVSVATVPAADLTVFGIVRALGAFDVRITAQQFMEFEDD